MARIIVTGATGFIGRNVVAALLDRRHTVVGVHRGDVPPSLATRPRFESVSVDFRKMNAAENWTAVIENADAVINCANSSPASKALFQACLKSDTKRVVQISTFNADAHTSHAKSQRDADDSLMATDLDWVVVRPSLVYGNGFCGGAAITHGLAAYPGAIPLPGNGAQTFQPICMDDMVGIVSELCEATSFNQVIIEPVGPDVLSLKDILLKLRHWLDVPGSRTISVPNAALKISAKLGDLLRWPTLNSVALAELSLGDNKTANSFRGLYAPGALRMDHVLVAKPSSAQDRWHARRVFLAPLITLVLALFWLMSGALEFLRGGTFAVEVIRAIDIGEFNPVTLTWVLAGWNVALGILLVLPLSTRLLFALQGLTIVSYTAVLSITMPLLLLDPLGPLLKNIPILALIFLWAAVRHRR